MNNMAFLLNLRISGIKNIKKEIKIDFYGKKINKGFDPEKYRIKGIYGENGSGKTAIVAAIEIVKGFIFDKNYLRDSQNLSLLKELINKNTNEYCLHCEYVTSLISLKIFEYEVVIVRDVTNDEVYVSYESLKCKENSSDKIPTTMFECKNGEFVKLNVDEQIKEELKGYTRNLLLKQSALYLIFAFFGQEEKKEKMPTQLVCSMLFFLSLGTYFDSEDRHKDYCSRQKIEDLKKGNLSVEKYVEELINTRTIGGSRVPIDMFDEYEKRIKRLEKFVQLFKPELKSIDIEKKEVRDCFECDLLFNYGDYRVNKEFESTGIKKIIELFDALVLASAGGIVFIDEIDSNINDVYLCELIDYFKKYGRGQICFTSHNTDPMNIIKDNKKSIDFLSRDNRIISWVKNGHYQPDNSYRNGMVMGLPFNIEASDFISIFEGDE